MKYLIYHTETGDVEENCPYCSIQTASTMEDFELDPIAADHSKKILTLEEERLMAEVDPVMGRLKNKVDKNTGQIRAMSAQEHASARGRGR